MNNDKEFYTLAKKSTAEIIEKKSRFIANAYHVNSKEEAENLTKKLECTKILYICQFQKKMALYQNFQKKK